MSRAAKFRRLGLWLLLANSLLVCAVAIVRHADADESEPPSSDVPRAAANVPPPPHAPLPTSGPSPAGPVTITEEAIVAPPLTSDGPPRSRLSNDPVLDELRKLVRDPESGLDVPPIQIPSLKTPPVTDPLDPTRLHHPVQTSSADEWSRLMQRTASLHQLASAAYTLSREAQALADAGQTDEAERIKQQVAELRAMLAELATLQ